MPPIAGPEPLTLKDVIVERRDSNGARVSILDISAFRVAPGEKIGLRGPSGAGKTTFLDVACGLLEPSRGTVFWGETNITAIGLSARDRWRARMIGFVFQDFHLVPELSILDNLLLPFSFDRWTTPVSLQKAALEFIDRLSLPRASRRAGALSRGEQQRVAIARALLREPRLIVADEPTASLDVQNAMIIGELLVTEAARCNATLLVASHDGALLERMDRIVGLRAGRLEDLS